MGIIQCGIIQKYLQYLHHCLMHVNSASMLSWILDNFPTEVICFPAIVTKKINVLLSCQLANSLLAGTKCVTKNITGGNMIRTCVSGYGDKHVKNSLDETVEFTDTDIYGLICLASHI